MDVFDYSSPSSVARVHLRRTVMLCLLMLLSPVADSLPCCSFSLASREHGSFPLASKSNNCKWQFARCVQTYESLIFLNLRVNCTNVLDLEEVHSCSGYSSTNLDRIRLQNSRVFFSQNRFSVA